MPRSGLRETVAIARLPVDSRRPSPPHFALCPRSRRRCPRIRFDRFVRYAELTEIVHAFAAEYPELVSRRVDRQEPRRPRHLAGHRHQSSDRRRHRQARVLGRRQHPFDRGRGIGRATLYFLNQLVTQYGTDPDVTRALDTRAFYICPRINPDGAEWALADEPKLVRSSTRAYPYDEEPIEGLTVEDIDGDGRILQMRIADPNGLWKAHPEEPRLMVRRDPTRGRRHATIASCRRAGSRAMTASP